MLDYKEILNVETNVDSSTIDVLELSELIAATERDIVDVTILSNYIDNASKYPEVTGYVYGVEGNVLETVKNAIVNFFKKIFEVLKKIFNWIKGLFSKKEKRDLEKEVKEANKQNKAEVLDDLNRMEKSIITKLRNMVFENMGLVSYLLYIKENNIDFIKEMKVTYEVAGNIARYVEEHAGLPKHINCEKINKIMDELKEINYQAHILQQKTNYLRIFTFIKPKNNKELYGVRENIVELKTLTIDEINNDLLADLYKFSAKIMDELLKTYKEIERSFEPNEALFDFATSAAINKLKDGVTACINAIVTRLRPLIVATGNLSSQMLEIKIIFKKISSLIKRRKTILKERREVEEEYGDIKL